MAFHFDGHITINELHFQKYIIVIPLRFMNHFVETVVNSWIALVNAQYHVKAMDVTCSPTRLDRWVAMKTSGTMATIAPIKLLVLVIAYIRHIQKRRHTVCLWFSFLASEMFVVRLGVLSDISITAGNPASSVTLWSSTTLIKFCSVPPFWLFRQGTSQTHIYRI